MATPSDQKLSQYFHSSVEAFMFLGPTEPRFVQVKNAYEQHIVKIEEQIDATAAQLHTLTEYKKYCLNQLNQVRRKYRTSK